MPGPARLGRRDADGLWPRLMRVVAGVAKGHRLSTPPGRDTRPTSERVREALFNILGGEVAEARVCDLFAGSGALGIEALSRGAAHAVFVESAAQALATVQRNLDRTGFGERASLHRGDAARFCSAPTGGPFDLVLVDPPFRHPLGGLYRMLEELHTAGGMTAGAMLVVSRHRRDPELDAPAPHGLASAARRAYGDTVLLLLRASDLQTGE